jgi:polyhydroxybutyrate depolymerase
MRLFRVTVAVLLSAALAAAAPQTASAGTAAAPRDYPVPSAGCLATTSTPTGETVTAHLASGGLDRTYYLHLPAGYRSHHPAPVVLAFHGHNGTGKDIEAFSGIDALGAIAVYPVGLPGTDGETSWQSAPYAAPGVDDVRFVSDLLDRLQRTLCVDPNRVYATGKSNGGGFTALLACQLPHRIAAFATVSGAFYPGTARDCATSTPVPLVDFHGTADPVIAYDGGTSHGARLPAMADWVRGWADHNRCAAETSTPIGTDVTELAWHGCADNSPIRHYRITGGGHTWPGAVVDSGPGAVTRTVSATAVLWRFFTAHTLSARWF